MSRTISCIGRAFVDAARVMLKHEIPRDAAAISYFGLFALFPASLLIVALVDSFFGWMHLHKSVLQSIIALFPGSGKFLSSNLNEITTPSAAIVLSCVLVVTWCSTWIFTFIENSMNRIWGIYERRTFWESRVRSTTLLALGGSFLMASAIITAYVSTAGSAAQIRLQRIAKYPAIDWMWYLILMGTGFLIAILVFSCIYKLMTHGNVRWLEALSGGLIAAAVWESGSYVFAKVVPYFDYQRVYGKAGAIIALMAWVYTSTLILLFGAAFSAKLHRPCPELQQTYTPFRDQTELRSTIRLFRGSR